MALVVRPQVGDPRWSGALAAPAVTFEKGRTTMASSGKKKTTFAKLAREQKLRERRRDKQAKKEARKASGVIDPAQPRGAESVAADRLLVSSDPRRAI